MTRKSPADLALTVLNTGPALAKAACSQKMAALWRAGGIETGGGADGTGPHATVPPHNVRFRQHMKRRMTRRGGPGGRPQRAVASQPQQPECGGTPPAPLEPRTPVGRWNHTWWSRGTLRSHCTLSRLGLRLRWVGTQSHTRAAAAQNIQPKHDQKEGAYAGA